MQQFKIFYIMRANLSMLDRPILIPGREGFLSSEDFTGQSGKLDGFICVGVWLNIFPGIRCLTV